MDRETYNARKALHNRNQRDRKPGFGQYHDAQRRARKQGAEFSLTKGHVFALAKLGCYYCDRPFMFRPSGHNTGPVPESFTLDRVDPARGYTEENVVGACFRCNRAKSNTSPELLRQIGDRAARHLADYLEAH